MYLNLVNGIIYILVYGLNSVYCEDKGKFGKLCILCVLICDVLKGWNSMIFCNYQVV